MGDMGLIKQALTNGHSWTLSKQQAGMLVLADPISPNVIADPHDVDLLLSINGEMR